MQKIDYIVTDPHSPDAKCHGSLADLVLDALVIPRCGLIPPFLVLRSVLRTGGGDAGTSPGCTWEPFDLSAEDYSTIVEQLERMTPEDLRLRHRDPQFQGEIQSDHGAPDTENYADWLDSLVHRGLLPGGPFRQARRR